MPRMDALTTIKFWADGVAHRTINKPLVKKPQVKKPHVKKPQVKKPQVKKPRVKKDSQAPNSPDAQEQSLKHGAEEAKRSKPGEEPGQEVKKTKVDTKAATSSDKATKSSNDREEILALRSSLLYVNWPTGSALQAILQQGRLRQQANRILGKEWAELSARRASAWLDELHVLQRIQLKLGQWLDQPQLKASLATAYLDVAAKFESGPRSARGLRWFGVAVWQGYAKKDVRNLEVFALRSIIRLSQGF